MLRFLFTTIICAFTFTSQAMPNIKFPTLGGVQFWNDTSIHSGWRIQRNAITGHYRLLDPNKIRHAWGGLDHCNTKIKGLNLPVKTQQKVFLLLHGLGRSHFSMNHLAQQLRSHGHQAYALEYASLIQPIDRHSADLQKICESFKQHDIHIITHSYGGIVLRHLTTLAKPNISSAVLMAAPNQGSVLVDTLSKLKLNYLLGPSAHRLGTHKSSLPNSLPAPPCRFITLAGAKEPKLSNLPFGFLYKERSDGLVLESETRHMNAEAHFSWKVSHTFIMNSDKSLEIILDYCSEDK